MTDIQKEIKEALEKATPGPWEWITDGLCLFPKNGVDYGDYILFIQKSAGVNKADAHLIANAPTWLLHQQEFIDQKDKQLKNFKDAWDEQTEEVRSLRAGYVSANAKDDEQFYFWEPFAENHLETLTGGVVIRAEWIRQLIQEAVEQKDAEIVSLQRELEEQSEISHGFHQLANKYHHQQSEQK